MEDFILKSFSESAQIIKNSSSLSGSIKKAIDSIVSSLQNGNKIILFGNGGSAADAQHIAAEFIGRFKLERKSLPAISLTTDSSALTALSNDYSSDIVFSRQCEALVGKNDIVIGISTSGNSKNVLNGILASKKLGAFTIGLLGNNGGVIAGKVDLALTVDSDSTARIQEAHRTIYHIICESVEASLAKN